jgi:hypothetical protein
MLPKPPFRKRETAFQGLESGSDNPLFTSFQFLRPVTGAPGEREFITATEIGPSGDIDVVAQFQRNAGIHVALSASA